MKNQIKSATSVALLLLAAPVAAHQRGIIETVRPGSPAAIAGLREGDTLLRLDGHEIETADDLHEVLSAHLPGETLRIAVLRGEETVELEMTLGSRPEGGVLVGFSIALAGQTPAPGDPSSPPGQDTVRGDACVDWVEATYKLETTIAELDPGLSERFGEIRTCMAGDLDRMPETMPLGWCDNVFKIHCSGLDLLTDLGESMIEGCEAELFSSLGLKPGEYESWGHCVSDRIFDGYTTVGTLTTGEACRTTWLEACATSLDGVLPANLSESQKTFAACCVADSLDACPMIEGGFSRGPCLDQPVCVNVQTSEWVSCSPRQ